MRHHAWPYLRIRSNQCVDSLKLIEVKHVVIREATTRSSVDGIESQKTFGETSLLDTAPFLHTLVCVWISIFTARIC